MTLLDFNGTLHILSRCSGVFFVEGWDDFIMFLSLVTTIESDLGHVLVVAPLTGCNRDHQDDIGDPNLNLHLPLLL